MHAFEAQAKTIEREGARIWTAVPPPQQIRPKSDRPLPAMRVLIVKGYPRFGKAVQQGLRSAAQGV